MNKPRPLNQAQIFALEKAAGLRLEDLLEYFGLELRRANRFYVGSCPVHGGTKKSSFNIFHSGDEIIGNWRCFSHSCHEHFHPSLTGFVRGYLSHTKYGWRDKRDFDKECPFIEAIEFLKKFTNTNNKDLSSITIDYMAIEQHKFSNHMKNIYAREEPTRTLDLPRETVVRSLDIPAEYFTSRGFSKGVLKKYDVGLCTTPGREMTMRAVAPIYNDTRDRVIGCTGRSIFEVCPICKSHHNPTHECPQDYNIWKFCKWRHNYGFKGENYLYNYWFAKKHIAESCIAIIVESPGNVWRLEEAGINMSVATFGAHLTDGQRFILDRSGALALIVLTDPDEAGRLAARAIRESCGSTYSIYEPRFGEGDVADNEVLAVQEKLFPVIHKVKRDLGL